MTTALFAIFTIAGLTAAVMLFSVYKLSEE